MKINVKRMIITIKIGELSTAYSPTEIGRSAIRMTRSSGMVSIQLTLIYRQPAASF